MSEHNGIVLGRFQPLHLGHVEYMQAAKDRCDRLFVGITNPDAESGIYTSADPRRSLTENNPYTYRERMLMIEDALLGRGWAASDFCFLPAPLLEADRLTHYLPDPRSTVAYLTVYDQWGEEKVRMMRSRGFDVDVMWTRTYAERLTTGTEIRALIRDHGDWKHLVPDEVARHVEALEAIDVAS